MLTYPNGDEFEGAWSASGDKDKRGTMRYASGAVYEGFWLRNKQHGLGRRTEADGSVLGGGWLSWTEGRPDLFHRHGGDLYGGDYDTDGITAHGTGALLYADGHVYEGGFVKGVEVGFGVLRYPMVRGEASGRVKYEGFFDRGKFWGHGTLRELGKPFEAAAEGSSTDGSCNSSSGDGGGHLQQDRKSVV